MVDLKAIDAKMLNMKNMFKKDFPQACEALEKDNIVHTLSEALKEKSDNTPQIHNKSTTKVREK